MTPRQQTLTLLQMALAYLNMGFTKHVFARNAKGRVVVVDDTTAVRWCALGALYRAETKLPVLQSTAWEARALVAKQLPPSDHGGGDTIVKANDSLFGKWRVKRAFKRAIRELEGN
jgi:hypothetical protein